MADDVFTIENGATLREVIQRLKGVPPSYDDGFRVLVLERERLRNEGICEKLVRRISELESRLQGLKDKLRNALAKSGMQDGKTEMKKMR